MNAGWRMKDKELEIKDEGWMIKDEGWRRTEG